MKIDTILLLLLVALGCAAVKFLYDISTGMKKTQEDSEKMAAGVMTAVAKYTT